MLTWPDASAVDRAVRQWAAQVAEKRGDVLRIGYFGSYARGDWGVGSDIDLIIVLEHYALPFEKRAVEWDTGELPVPADVLVYTAGEWERLGVPGGMSERLRREVVWVYARASSR